jgi:hypothetical protein
MKQEKTDAEISQEFLEKYRELVRKYKRDFLQEPPKVVKLEFVDPPKEPSDKPAIK